MSGLLNNPSYWRIASIVTASHDRRFCLRRVRGLTVVRGVGGLSALVAFGGLTVLGAQTHTSASIKASSAGVSLTGKPAAMSLNFNAKTVFITAVRRRISSLMGTYKATVWRIDDIARADRRGAPATRVSRDGALAALLPPGWL
jgi:hypothetical protein